MGNREAESSLARLQREQHGVFTRRQAIDVGVPASTVDGRVRIGRYRVLRPGVYCEAGTPETWHLRATAAVHWAGGDAVLARHSAAFLHDLPIGRGPADLRLLVGTRCFDVQPGIRVHRTATNPPHHHAVVDGLPVTSVVRTVCDLGAELAPSRLRRVVAAAARTGALDATSLRIHLAELGRVRGAVALRRLADEMSPMEAQCRSGVETSYLRLARTNGITPTAMNHPVRDATGRRRYLDAVHLPERLPIELDSTFFHSHALDRNDDRAREVDLEVGVAWHHPVRITDVELATSPGTVVARVRTALREIRDGVRPPLARPAPLVE